MSRLAPRRPASLLATVLVVLALVLVSAACSGGTAGRPEQDGTASSTTGTAVGAGTAGPGSEGADRPPIDARAPSSLPPPATAAPGEGPRVEAFEVVPPEPCGPEGAQVTVRYVTSGAVQVAFAVDQASPTGGEAPPLAGEHVLDVACDDRPHTVVLVALDATGAQAVASAVVATSRG